jgi:lipase chaperone LimK
MKAFERLETTAEDAGHEIFKTLRQDHLQAIEKEKERGKYFFSSRQKAIELVGLPEVKQYRLKNLEREKSEWQQDLKAAAQIIPEIRPLLLLSIEKENTHG